MSDAASADHRPGGGAARGVRPQLCRAAPARSAADRRPARNPHRLRALRAAADRNRRAFRRPKDHAGAGARSQPARHRRFSRRHRARLRSGGAPRAAAARNRALAGARGGNAGSVRVLDAGGPSAPAAERDRPAPGWRRPAAARPRLCSHGRIDPPDREPSFGTRSNQTAGIRQSRPAGALGDVHQLDFLQKTGA